MRYITTIASGRVSSQLNDLVTSLRRQGWHHRIYVFCPDNDVPRVPEDCTIVKCAPWWGTKGGKIAPAMIKPDVFLYEKWQDGDEILYFDCADIVVLCEPNEIFKYASGSLWCAHKCRLARHCNVPADKALQHGLDIKYTAPGKAVNSGVIIGSVSDGLRSDAQLWKDLLRAKLADPTWNSSYTDQDIFTYIFKSRKGGGSRHLPDIYNYRDFNQVRKLQVTEDGVFKKSGGQIFVPHASGPAGIPKKILYFATGVVGPLNVSVEAVSVIIPAWNEASRIGRVLDSVKRQTWHKKIEILLGVDNCKSTLEAIKKYDTEGMTVRVFWFLERQGCYKIRNSLAKEARYDYLLFFDADDEMLPSYVESMVCSNSNIYIAPRGRKRRSNKQFGAKYIGNAIIGIHKKTFLQIGGFEPWICAADTEFHIRAAHCGLTKIVTGKDVFVRHKHGGNLTENPETDMMSPIRKSYHAEIAKRKSEPYHKVSMETASSQLVIEKRGPDPTYLDTFVIVTTGSCQLNCNGCTAGKWRAKNRRFHLTLRDLRAFLDACLASNYRMGVLRLTGGEPLLWRNLDKGLAMIRASGVVKKIKLFTNAVAATSEKKKNLEHVISNVDRLAISDYGVCPENVERLKELAKNKTHVSSVDRTYFNDPTEFHAAPVDDRREEYMPCVCGCRGHTLVGDRVYVCTDAVWMFGWRDPEPDWIWTDVKTGFLEGLPLGQHENYDFCSYCTANKTVRQTLRKVKT